RQERGTLFVAPVGAIAAHAVAMSRVELRYEADGAVMIRNGGPELVRGATFTARAPVLVDGITPAGARPETAGYTFWLDLIPGRESRATREPPSLRPPPPRNPPPLAR